MIDDNLKDILYKQFRNLPIYECPEFIKWMHKNKSSSDLEFHHGTGSQGSQKLNDLLGIMLNRPNHAEAEKNKKQFFVDNLPVMVKNLCDFVMHLTKKESRK